MKNVWWRCRRAVAYYCLPGKWAHSYLKGIKVDSCKFLVYSFLIYPLNVDLWVP